MEKTIQINQICDHICNGFRITSVPVVKGSEISGYIFQILPNRSSRYFCFLHIQEAYDFCKRFTNKHSDNFWLNLWNSFPLYHFSLLEQIVKPNDYLL